MPHAADALRRFIGEVVAEGTRLATPLDVIDRLEGSRR
jgi:hypothetical protein